MNVTGICSISPFLHNVTIWLSLFRWQTHSRGHLLGRYVDAADVNRVTTTRPKRMANNALILLLVVG